MKINRQYNPIYSQIPNNDFYLQLNDYFLSFLEEAPDFEDQNEMVEDGNYTYHISESAKKYFEEHYIFFSQPLKYEQHSDLLNKIFDINKLPKDLISENEVDLLRLIFGRTKNQVSIIKGNVGWGKSTLIKYVVQHLLSYRKNEFKYLPLYIDFNNHINYLNSGLKKSGTLKIFYQILGEIITSFSNEILQVDNETFWSFLKSKKKFSKLKLFEESISKLENTSNEKVKKNRLKILNSNEVILSALEYISKKLNSKVILFVDNLDPVNINPTQIILIEIYKIIKEYKIKSVFSFRPNTYAEIENKSDGIFDAFTTRSFTIKPPKAKFIFKSKIRHLKNSSKDDKMNLYFNDTKLEVSSTYSLIESYVTLLKDSSVSDFFNNISGGNLRIWNKMLLTYFRSGLLKNHLLYKNYLNHIFHKENIPKGYNPSWIAFDSIITSNHKTYFPSYESDIQKDLIINLFNNKTLSHNNTLIRLWILKFYLNESCELSSFKRLYKQIFPLKHDKKNIDLSINYAVRAMLNAGLLSSNRIYKLDDDKLVNSVTDLKITDTGKYYYNKLLNAIEYLKFMKDDVDYPQEIFEKIKGTIEEKSNIDLFNDLIEFSKYIFEVEKEVIIKLERDTLKLYLNHFAPDKSRLFFSFSLITTLTKFQKRRGLDGHIEITKRFNSLFKEIMSENKLIQNFL